MSDHKIQNMLLTTQLWHRFKKEMCKDCEACCCYLPVEADAADLVKLNILDSFHLELSEKEQQKAALRHPHINRYNNKTKKYTLTQTSSGACVNLDSSKRCKVYTLRPKTCENHPHIGPKPGFCAFIKKSVLNKEFK